MPALISSAVSKVQTIAWFARRPSLYREALRRIIGFNLTTTRSVARATKTRVEEQRWCAAHESDVADLLSALGLPPLEAVSDRFSDEFAEATAVAKRLDMGGPAHIDLLHHLSRHLPANTVIETGVAAGWSSLAILLALQDRPGASLQSTDMPYPKRGNADQVGAVVPARLKDPWTLYRLADRDALPKALRRIESLDLAHYDSDKSHRGRSYAYALLWQHLRDGGVLISDDIEDNAAFREFAQRVERKCWVMRKAADNYAGILIK